MRSDPLWLVPCGSAKSSVAARASEFYLGGYHRSALRLARAEAGGEDSSIVILSAKYGLCRLDDWLLPYDLKMGEKGSVHPAVVRSQAADSDWLGRRVIVFGGLLYAEFCQKIWPTCETPLVGTGGIGKQLAWMKKRLEEIERRGKHVQA